MLRPRPHGVIRPPAKVRGLQVQHFPRLALQRPTHLERLAGRIGAGEQTALVQPGSERAFAQGKPVGAGMILRQLIADGRLEVNVLSIDPTDPHTR